MKYSLTTPKSPVKELFISVNRRKLSERPNEAEDKAISIALREKIPLIPVDEPIITVPIFTGMRIGELSHLQWQHQISEKILSPPSRPPFRS